MLAHESAGLHWLSEMCGARFSGLGLHADSLPTSALYGRTSDRCQLLRLKPKLQDATQAAGTGGSACFDGRGITVAPSERDSIMPKAVFAVFAVFALVAFGAGSAAAGTALGFKSPTGNIRCASDSRPPAYVYCSIKHETWRQDPTRPKRCRGVFVAHEFELIGGAAHAGMCRGASVPECYPGCRTLRYETHIDIGPIRCTSSKHSGPSHNGGIACRYMTGSHAGFRLASEDYTISRGVTPPPAPARSYSWRTVQAFSGKLLASNSSAPRPCRSGDR